MHRVELKAVPSAKFRSLQTVPNAPCGVERVVFVQNIPFKINVPNAPCGVES